MEPRIAVTGLGMVSSLGHDIVSSCAAARAGISRARELDYFKVKREDNGEVESVLGHPAHALTFGFEGFSRLVALAWPAFENLLSDSALRDLNPGRTGLYLALPDFERVNTGFDLVIDDRTRERLTKREKASPPSPETHPYGMRLCQKLTELAGLRIPSAHWSQTYGGHCGTTLAFRQAFRDLCDGKIDYAVLGGVDSLVEEETLQWFYDTGRLKTGDQPAGVQPGEAAAFVFLELEKTARRRKAKLRATILATAVGSEENELLAGKPTDGLGLSETIAALFSELPRNDAPPPWIMTDQNGEPYRAYEWGYAVARLSSQAGRVRDAALYYPAIAFGDTGAASGAVSLCVAARAFSRGYAMSREVLVISSSDNHDRAAIFLADSVPT